MPRHLQQARVSKAVLKFSANKEGEIELGN
jgi:hypothetical protein